MTLAYAVPCFTAVKHGPLERLRLTDSSGMKGACSDACVELDQMKEWVVQLFMKNWAYLNWTMLLQKDA